MSDDRKLIGPAHAHRDAPCTDACFEPNLEFGEPQGRTETITLTQTLLGGRPYVLIEAKAVEPEDEDDDGLRIAMQAGGGAEEAPGNLALLFATNLPAADNPLTMAVAEFLAGVDADDFGPIRQLLASFAEFVGFPMPELDK